MTMFWVFLASSFVFVNGMSKCISNCSTVSHHTLKNTLHTIPCSIQSNECAAFSEVAIPASKPVSKNPGQGWYLFSDGEFDKIALNFSWEREHEASIASLQGYYFSVIETDSTNFPYPNLEKYYCFDIKLQFNLHIFAKYYYDCYGTAPSEEIRPGKKFIVYVGSLPQPGPRLEQNYYKRTIKIPGCDDPRLSRVKDCVERNSMKLKATEYFCENRTAVIDYNLPKTFGSSATLILCYAETYRKSFTWCETESFIDHLPMSNSNYTLVVPDKFNITKNISMSIHSDRDLRQVAYMKFVCSKPTEEPAASGLNSDILIVIVVCVLLALIFMVVAFVLAKRKSVKKLCQSRRNHQMPEPPEKFEPNITNETIVTSKVIKNTRTVCITFVGDNEMHKEVLLAFASFLQNDLGFKVIFELWDQDNIYKDASTWIANTLRDSDKVIVVWSPKACEKWNKFSEGENTDQQDLFTPILKQVQKDLVFNKNQGKYFFAFFEYCSEADIPEKFRDIIYRHFRLMNQFKELYFRLLDIEMFQPGSYEKQDRVELQHYFEQINKFGLPLKNRIENMCNFVKKNPNWYKSEEQYEEHEEVCPLQSECEETFMVNKLNIAPPPPLMEPTQDKDPNEEVKIATKMHRAEISQMSESVNTRKPVENMESYVATDNGEPTVPNPQLQQLLPKKQAKQASEPLRLKIASRIPCENAVDVSQNEYPVLVRLNTAKPDANSPQDSGICTLSPQPDSLTSNCSIHASSFHFDDDEDDIVRMGESANSPELAPIDLVGDPWKSLASFNV